MLVDDLGSRDARRVGILVADPPVPRVRRKEGQRNSFVARVLEEVPLRRGPVLVVSDRKEHPGTIDRGERTSPDVHARRERYVVPIPLEKAGHRHFPFEHLAEAAVVIERPIEADLRGIAVRQRARCVAVQRFSAPEVVRLVRVHARLQEEIGRTVINHDERHESRLAILAHELECVQTRKVLRADRYGESRRPGTADETATRIDDRARTAGFDGDRPAGPDAPGAGAAIPAETIEVPHGRGRHVG